MRSGFLRHRRGGTDLHHGGNFRHRKIPTEQLTLLVREFFDLRPYGLIQMLDLLQPIYRETAAYGHFGREHFPWEKPTKRSCCATRPVCNTFRCSAQSGVILSRGTLCLFVPRFRFHQLHFSLPVLTAGMITLTN